MLVLPPYSDRFDPMAQYRGTLGPSKSQDHARMDGPGLNQFRIRKIQKNQFPPVLLYCGRTRAPTDMVGVLTDFP